MHATVGGGEASRPGLLSQCPSPPLVAIFGRRPDAHPCCSQGSFLGRQKSRAVVSWLQERIKRMKIREGVGEEVSRMACNCVKVWDEGLGLGANGLASVAAHCGACPISSLNSALKRINLYLFTLLPLVLLSSYDILPSSSISGWKEQSIGQEATGTLPKRPQLPLFMAPSSFPFQKKSLLHRISNAF